MREFEVQPPIYEWCVGNRLQTSNWRRPIKPWHSLISGRSLLRELSGGMRRRVSVLRALLAESDCVVMDEPLKGLDEDTKERTIKYILEKTTGKTLIFVTHEEKEERLLKADGIIEVL